MSLIEQIRKQCISNPATNEKWVRLSDIEASLWLPYGYEWQGRKILVEQHSTKSVYQWAFRKPDSTHWKISKYLLSEQQANDTLKQSYEVMKVAGPFEVPI